MEPLYKAQIVKNSYVSKAFLVITFNNEKNGLYETHIIYSPKKYSLIEVPVQRYKMRTEAIEGHNAWLYTLRQEDFVIRNINTAELHIITKEGDTKI